MSGAETDNALPLGYRLEEYVLEAVLGHGGFGITYRARDTRLGAQVAIKEYFPQAYALRERTHTIRPNTQGDTGDAENYRWGLQEFLKEARALAQFKHANIVRVLRFLEANGTAYMAMEYEEGESLSEHLARHGGYLSEPVLLGIFLPVLTGLQAVHDAGLLHLDIKPDNIYLRRNGPPMLIDFGAARQRKGAGRGEKVALTPGYAALEQYPGHGELGPASDVYSMGATLYRCITGQEPVDALAREQALHKLHRDPLVAATTFERPHYSRHIRECVDAATALRVEDRPASAFALQNGLMGKDMAAARPGVAVSSFSRGTGFVGVLGAQEQKKRRRFIPRGPLEKLLVTLVFLAVLIVAPVQIMLATGHLSEDELYAYIDRLRDTAVETGKRVTRGFEESVLGVTRPPEYTPPTAPAAPRVAAAPPAEPQAGPPFDTAKQVAITQALPAPALSLAFLLDGKLVALAFDDGRVEIRNAENGALTHTFAAAHGTPAALAASPDGRRLAFSADGHVIHVWDLQQNIFLTELPGHLDAILALAFAPDGRRLASVGRDQSAMLWDVDSGQMLRDLSRPKTEPLAVAFAPDGGMLAVADSAGGIRYWEMTNLRDVAYVPTRDQPITALAYAPDGKWFALGGEQGYLGLWDVSRQQPDRTLGGAPDTLHALAFSPDSRWLIVAGSDNALQLWDVARGTLAQRWAGGNHQTYALALTDDGKQVAAAGIDAQLTLWK